MLRISALRHLENVLSLIHPSNIDLDEVLLYRITCILAEDETGRERSVSIYTSRGDHLVQAPCQCRLLTPLSSQILNISNISGQPVPVFDPPLWWKHFLIQFHILQLLFVVPCPVSLNLWEESGFIFSKPSSFSQYFSLRILVSFFHWS